MKTWNFVKAAFGVAFGWELGKFTFDFLLALVNKIINYENTPAKPEPIRQVKQNDEVKVKGFYQD